MADCEGSDDIFQSMIDRLYVDINLQRIDMNLCMHQYNSDLLEYAKYCGLRYSYLLFFQSMLVVIIQMFNSEFNSAMLTMAIVLFLCHSVKYIITVHRIYFNNAKQPVDIITRREIVLKVISKLESENRVLRTK